MAVKEITDLKVPELWKEFKENFWDHWEAQDELYRNFKKKAYRGEFRGRERNVSNEQAI